ncbi:MAG: hypothetical protein LBE36_01960, partial [Flavobacteriaceae bacterium]|nr:hypothetical protein [Flavobacteriaceae bacterium]
MDFDLNSIKKFYHFKSKEHKSFFQNIPEEISVDLYLDLVFFKLDRTFSKIGKQYFYSKFRIIEKDEDEFFKNYTKYFHNKND